MSEVPKKLYWVLSGGSEPSYMERSVICKGDKKIATYIREDLTSDQEQRRRVFVEVALANDKATMSWIAEKAEAILSESERFASKKPLMKS